MKRLRVESQKQGQHTETFIGCIQCGSLLVTIAKFCCLGFRKHILGPVGKVHGYALK